MNTKLITVLTIFNTVAVFLLLLISFKKDYLPIYEYKNWSTNENKKVYDYMDRVDKTCSKNVDKVYKYMDLISEDYDKVDIGLKSMNKSIDAVNARLDKVK